MALIEEVILPNSGKGGWCKVLTDVDRKARDGYGWNGEFKTSGDVDDLESGTVLLERYYKGRTMCHTLYVLTEDGEWEPRDASEERSWSVRMRKTARDLLGQTDDG